MNAIFIENVIRDLEEKKNLSEKTIGQYFEGRGITGVYVVDALIGVIDFCAEKNIASRLRFLCREFLLNLFLQKE